MSAQPAGGSALLKLTVLLGPLLLAACGLGPSVADGSPPELPLDRAVAERELLRAVNHDRAELGRAPLVLGSVLGRAAQRQADAVAAHGAPDPEVLAIEQVAGWLKEAGQPARRLVQGFVLSNDPPAELATFWVLGNPESYQALLEPELRELGVGAARLEGTPFYTVLAALSAEGDFDDRVKPLENLAEVRRQMLERVNAERAKAGLAPLRRHHRLETTAQHFAEEMLTHGFYGHVSPEGETVLDRAKAAGYRLARVGENIASGQSSVQEVMDGWMQSPPHRANLLDPAFVDFGTGLAFGKTGGKTEGGFEILWVQCFGRPSGRSRP